MRPIGRGARCAAAPSVEVMSQPLAPSTSTSSPPSAAPARLHHLDALRGGALLLGVLLHALMPFVPGELWLVNDSHDSWGALSAVGVIHLFRMVLFMALAGYFGHMVLHRRGAGSYLRDRLTRIGLPLVVFLPGLLALMFAAVSLDAALRGEPFVPPPPEPGAPTGLLALPTMHLWFLLLLLEIVLVVVVARAAALRILGPERAGRISRAIGSALSSPVALVLVAVPYAVGLLVQDGAGTSLIEPRGLVPVAGASIAYGGAFVTGWFLRSRPEALGRLERQWIPQLAIAVVLSPVVLLATPGSMPAVLLAVLAALAGWAWVFALLGLTARLVRRRIGWVRYLADSSYWVYLLHLPLLLLVQAPLTHLALPLLVELALALAVVMAVLLVSYDLLVRSTWIGAWLNGHRRPRVLIP